MKKYIYIVLVLLLIGGTVIVRRRYFSPKTEGNVNNTSESTLAANWTTVTPGTADVKFEKKTDAGLKPQVVIKSFSTKDALKPAEYTDKLIAGAASSIPTLKINDDKRNSVEGKYTAFLSGFYQNKKLKVEILQRVYIVKEQVTVMTASYTGDLKGEINQMMDKAATEKSL